MHILILPPEEFIPPKSPVSAIFQYHQALALCDLGHKVGVLSVTPSLGLKPLLVSLFRKLTGRQIFYRQVRDAAAMGIFRAIVQSLLLPDKTRSENINGIDVLRRQLFCWSDGNFQEELNYYKRTLTSAFHIYIERHGLPDVVHVHNAWLAGTASLDFLRSKGIPFCITEHSTYYARNIIPEQCYPLLRDVYAAADVRIAVSPSLAKLLIDRQLAKDVRFIPNMLDPIFAQALPFTEKRRDVFTFFNVAELTEKKGHTNLLEAFASAFKGQPNIRLVIGGDGALMNTLRHHADVLGIVSQVEFTGMLDRASLRSRMMEANVFVLPSLFETFGVVVIEAMSCGKPVIATVCGGPEHILDASTGILIEAGNIKALAGAMIEMRARSGSYDPDLIRSKALGEYGPQVVAKSLEGVYHEILGTNQ